jgi:hypothetical protein
MYSYHALSPPYDDRDTYLIWLQCTIESSYRKDWCHVICGFVHSYAVLSEGFHTPWLPHFVTHLHTITHNDKVKICFIEIVANMLKMKWWNISFTNIFTPLWHSKLSSGASNFLWSSLRCQSTWLSSRVQRWPIQLFGHDLERHRSHSWQCISEQKLYHEVQSV